MATAPKKKTPPAPVKGKAPPAKNKAATPAKKAAAPAEEEEEAPAPKKAAKAAPKAPAVKKAPPAPEPEPEEEAAELDTSEMDGDELQEAIEAHELEVDLDDYKTLKAKRKAVQEAFDEKQAEDGDEEEAAEAEDAEEAEEAEEEEEEAEASGDVELYNDLLDFCKFVNPKFAVAQSAKESEPEFFARICKTVLRCKDEDWEKLNEASRDWVTMATNDYANKGKPIVVPPPGYPGADAEEAAPAKSSKVAPEAKAKHKEAQAKAKSEGKVPAKKAAKKAPTPREPGITARMRELAVLEDLSVEEISKQLTKEGFEDFKPSTISTIRGHAVATIKLLQANGRLKAAKA